MKVSILFIVPRYGSVNRGVEVFTRELVKRLDGQHFVTAVVSAPHGLSESGVEYLEKPLFRRESLHLFRTALLQRFVNRINLGPEDLEALSLMLRCYRLFSERSFKFIVPLGGTWTYRFAKWFGKDARIISIGQAGPVRANLGYSDFFVALTPTDQAESKRILPHVPTCVIPNGVDLSCFSYTDTLSKSRKRSKVILCAAALTPDKRHDLLFDAVLRVPQPVRVICLGDGPSKTDLMKHRLFKQGMVEFAAKPHDQMPSVYQAADVFTLASPKEAFGIVFLEALASGLPVVANDAPRQRYVVGETGFFCNVHDPVAYADALQRALSTTDDPRRRAHAKQFEWSEIVRTYSKLFTGFDTSDSH